MPYRHRVDVRRICCKGDVHESGNLSFPEGNQGQRLGIGQL